jgi:RHS repeat-associated protein
MTRAGGGISNEYEVLEDRYEYDAFGKPYQGDFSNGVGLGYTRNPYDPTTGLYNYGYRDYRPDAARFTMVDPVRDGNNWFAYVNNAPVNYVDPWGLSASDKGARLIVSGFSDVIGGSVLKGVNGLGLGLTSNSPELAKQSEKLISDGSFKIAVGTSLITGNTNTNGKDVIPIVGASALPPNVRNAYNGYESVNWQGNYPGQEPKTAAGRNYRNTETSLPTTDASGKSITYKEFDVNNKQPGSSRDAERLVRGNDGSTYYTGNHYGTGNGTKDMPSFIEIRK